MDNILNPTGRKSLLLFAKGKFAKFKFCIPLDFLSMIGYITENQK